ncbi:19924_t:CDS:2 [Rhizophagus irregularis]|nr:19924_t:CDS:2 [Rhizophagus irregularis]
MEQDLRLLINNSKYSDIEILCADEKKLYGCRAILAVRSEVFDRLLYNGMKETYEKQISLPKINSTGMEIVLEYTYTGSIKEESLTKDNIVEAFYAVDYFQLSDLKNFITKTVRNTNLAKNYSPELLSKVSEKMPLTEDNVFLNLLVEALAIISLNNIEFGRLSIPGLKYLLSITHKKRVPFATQEYEVFRYSAILSAKQVSNDAYVSLMERLPTLEQIENSYHVENNLIIDHQKVANEIKPLVDYIDFRRIKGQVLVDFIEPLGIIPEKIILSVYREMAKLNNSYFNDTRGIPLLMHVWDESACGSKLIIEDGGKIVRAPNEYGHQNVRAKIELENDGIFEWDVIIEKVCTYAWVGVCASENLNYETFAGWQPTGWVLGSNGNCCNTNVEEFNYCPSFHNMDGTIVTVHLDMNKRTCAFTVNGTKYREVSEWKLPLKLYPVVSLSHLGRFRIQPHQKNQNI